MNVVKRKPVNRIVVLPIKKGTMRVVNVSDTPNYIPGCVYMSEAAYAQWPQMWNQFYSTIGHLMNIAPGMWPE